MKIQFVNKMTWEQIDKVNKEKAICILPIGSLEQHGKHLPVGTDNIILEKSLENLGPIASHPDREVLIYPYVEYGSSVEHMRFPGTVSLKLKTLMSIVEDIVEVIVKTGFKNIMLMNSHGGNASLLQAMTQEFRYQYDINMFDAHYWGSDFFKFADEYIDASFKDECHAGEVETSLLMHWTPELVHMENATTEELSETAKFFHYNHGWLSSDVSKSGIIGNATKSTPEKGKVIAEKMEEKLAGILEEIAEVLDKQDSAAKQSR
ncbi:creatininase family protein [Clostridia bacterium]|nr:creatininase family protein [Clostridia bacterium]